MHPKHTKSATISQDTFIRGCLQFPSLPESLTNSPSANRHKHVISRAGSYIYIEERFAFSSHRSLLFDLRSPLPAMNVGQEDGYGIQGGRQTALKCRRSSYLFGGGLYVLGAVGELKPAK